MINQTQFTFYGYISNRGRLLEELELNPDVSLKALCEAAFIAWKLDFNQKVEGDYALALPLSLALSSDHVSGLGSSMASVSTSDIASGSIFDTASRLSECFICCSAFSSHRLFYRIDVAEFYLSPTLADFMQGAQLEPNAIGQLMTQGYLVPPQTLVKGVRQVANGESHIWQLPKPAPTAKKPTTSAKCLAHKTLSLLEKLNAMTSQSEMDYCYADELVNQSEKHQGECDKSIATLEQGEFNAFMALPVLSRLLNEPVTQKSQLNLFENLLALDDKNQLETDAVGGSAANDAYISEAGFETLRLAHKTSSKGHASALAELNQHWDKEALKSNKQHKALLKPILKSRLRSAFKAQRQSQLALRQDYQTQMLAFQGQHNFKPPSFSLWLDLTLTLPNRWQQERLVAEHLGKKVKFRCLTSDVIPHVLQQNKSVLEKAMKQVKGPAGAPDIRSYFCHGDDSLVNLYDAMQRLMLHGYRPVTHGLFKIVPPISAKLIKQQAQRQKVDAFCMQSLTLDHLSRHLDCSLASN